MISLQLRLRRLKEHGSIRTLLQEHRTEWEVAYRLFVERHFRRLPAPLDIRYFEPIQGFPLTIGNLNPLWHGRDLSAYIEVIPLPVEATPVPSSASTLVSYLTGGVATPHATTLTVDPQNMEINMIEVVFDEEDGLEEVDEDGNIIVRPISRLSLGDSLVSGRTSTASNHSYLTALTGNTSRSNPALSPVEEDDVGTLSMTTTTLVLSCLLQYTPELYGVASPHCFTVLRRYIIPEIVERVHQGEFEYSRYQQATAAAASGNAAGPAFSSEWESFVEFDRGMLRNCLEEWLSVGGVELEEVDGSLTSARQFHRDGRAAGLILLGAPSVGKTMFCRDLLRCLETMAPWMISIVYRGGDSNQGGGSRTTSKSDPRLFFDGAHFLEDLSIDAELSEPAHMPLTVGPYRTVEASPRGVQRMMELFRSFEAASQPGKIVLTVIDNLDALARSVQAQSIFTQMRAEMENAGFEFFILGTGSDPSVPSFDSQDSSKNQFRVSNFRTLKVYNMDLHRAFEFVLRQVRYPPSIAYPKYLLRHMRRCAIEWTRARHEPEWAAIREGYERRLHNMNIADLKKLGLHLCLDLGRTLSRFHTTDPTVLARESAEFFRHVLHESLERVLNSCSTISGLSPAVVATFPWVRADIRPDPEVIKAVDQIESKFRLRRQNVHFVRLEGIQSEEQREFRYDHPSIPRACVPSLLHHLHRRFAFRSSYVLEAPEQLLPYHPRLSANIPHPRANPFEEYIWQNKNSCLIINHVETAIGYHEELERSFSSGQEQDQSLGSSKSHGFGLHQHASVSVGAHTGWDTHTGSSNANSESLATDQKTGVGTDVHGGMDGFGGDGSAFKKWGVSSVQAQLLSFLLTEPESIVVVYRINECWAIRRVDRCRMPSAGV